MTLAGRLGRLLPALSVRERFLVALRDYKSDREISASIADLAPAHRSEYQDYARFVVALNNTLGTYVGVYASQAAFLEDHVEIQLEILNNAASFLEEQEGLPREEVSRRTLRRKKEVTVPAYLRGLAFRLQEQLLFELDWVWAGLRAIELVWSEAEQELGEDPVHPTTRDSLAKAKELVSASRSRLGARKKPKEPAAEMVEQGRRLVRQSARLQELQDDL